MTPLDQMEKVSPGDSTYDALMKMTARGVGRLPVMENGQIVGIITRQGLLDAIRIRAELKNRDNLGGTK
jgi:CBS domain-containing protein